MKNSKIVAGLHTDIYPPPVAHARPCDAKYLFLLGLSIIHNIQSTTKPPQRF